MTAEGLHTGSMSIHPLPGAGDTKVGRRQHECVLYRDSLEERQYVLPFLKEGFESGEHCLFVCPESSVEDWTAEMKAFGIDVAHHLVSGALVIATAESGARRRSIRLPRPVSSGSTSTSS